LIDHLGRVKKLKTKKPSQRLGKKNKGETYREIKA